MDELHQLLGEMLRENAQLREMLKHASDRTLAATAPMERAARAAEEIASREYTLLLKMAADIDAIKLAQAVSADNVKDVQREITGAFRKLDDDEHGHGTTQQRASQVREALNAFRDMPTLSKLLLIFFVLAIAGAAMAINDVFHTRKLPRDGQTHSELK